MLSFSLLVLGTKLTVQSKLRGLLVEMNWMLLLERNHRRSGSASHSASFFLSFVFGA